MRKLLTLILATALLVGCSTFERLGITEDIVKTGVKIALARHDLEGAITDAQLSEIVAIVKAEQRLQEIGEEIAEDARVQAKIEEIVDKYVVDGVVVVKDKKQPAAGADDIDLTTVIFDHYNVTDWPITSELQPGAFLPMIELRYDKANVWPGRDGVNANPWIIAEIDGAWRAATWEWLMTGQTVKDWRGKVFGDHIKRAAWPNNWMPKSGDTIYLMVSGLCRDSKRNVQERTQALKVIVP